MGIDIELPDTLGTGNGVDLPDTVFQPQPHPSDVGMT